MAWPLPHSALLREVLGIAQQQYTLLLDDAAQLPPCTFVLRRIFLAVKLLQVGHKAIRSGWLDRVVTDEAQP